MNNSAAGREEGEVVDGGEEEGGSEHGRRGGAARSARPITSSTAADEGKSDKTRKRKNHSSSSESGGGSSGNESDNSSSDGNGSSSSSGSSDSSSSDEDSGDNDNEVDLDRVKVKRIKLDHQSSQQLGIGPVSSNTHQGAKNPQTSSQRARLTVPQYLMAEMRIDSADQLCRAIRDNYGRVSALLMGKQVSASYAKTPISFAIEGITPESANQLRAFKGGPTVAQYIGQKQKIQLVHPEWPCLIQRGGKAHKSYYPMELLLIN